ncbi:cupin domain-containing protein [Embleya sp. NPDC127516]|uniref:cupin domain-containing protein n=1 Tax=Embleya sp. NPDC127516 TaxID=3363990 RepID=UPI0038115B3D
MNAPSDDRPSLESVILAAGSTTEQLPPLGPDARTVVFRRITFPPGGTTGWHYHPGPMLVICKTGTLVRTFADSSTDIITAGNCVLEPAGSENAHCGENRGEEQVVLYVVYFLADNQLLSVKVDPPSHAGPRATTS